MKHKNILIIDDDIVSISIGMQFLNDSGYGADYANSATEALEKFTTQQYDLILLDIVMPDMSGLELAKLLKSNPKVSSTPVIFLTAKTDTDTIIQAYASGGSEYITKPFNNQEFLLRIKNQLTIAEYRDSLSKDKENLKQLLDETTKQLLLKERKAAYGEVIQGIVHNLRAPLTVAKGRIDLLAEKDKIIKSNGGFENLSKEELIEYISISQKSHKAVDKAFEKLNNMVNSLLVKSSSDNNDSLEVFDLNTLLFSELEFYNANMFYKHEICKVVNLHTSPLMICASTAIISQLFGNILKNALEELFKNEAPEIYISSGKKDNYVFFTVKDNGRGIPNELKEKIFDPFFTTKPKSKKSEDDETPIGTGLGLHFCNKAVSDMGGKIEVLSTLDQGTEFVVYIPEFV